MGLIMKTFSDLEREAYIRGDVIIADIYGLLIENEDACGELADTYDKVRDLEWDVDYLTEVKRELEDDIEYWRQRAVKAEGELEEAKHVLESLSK
jgi:hypothetical protein